MTELLGPECPCGSGAGYPACCGPLHHGDRQARTAEELMRSRYSAYARGDADYVFRTWHPRTRPPDVAIDPRIRWTRLRVTDVGDEVVEFVASFEFDGRVDEMRERSRFERRAGRWFYVEDEMQRARRDSNP